MNDYICLDLETTGLNPALDKIIEIGAVKVTEGRIEGRFEQLVDPGRKLPEKAAQITGLSDGQLMRAPSIGEILPEFLNFAGELPLLGHNLLFDFSFVKKAAVNQGLSFEKGGVDTLKLARSLLPGLPSRSLEALCKHYEITYQPHRAFEDAMATHLLYQRMRKEFESCGLFTAKPLFYRVKRDSPASKAQKERLIRLATLYGVELETNVERLSKSEASRLADKIIFRYGNF